MRLVIGLTVFIGIFVLIIGGLVYLLKKTEKADAKKVNYNLNKFGITLAIIKIISTLIILFFGNFIIFWKIIKEGIKLETFILLFIFLVIFILFIRITKDDLKKAKEMMDKMKKEL